MTDRRLVVLFGSQTGTAHDVADRVVRDAKRRHFSSRAVAMDDFKMVDLLQEPMVVFVCSTTGQGDPPDNMKVFWKFLLRKDLPSNSLCNLHFAVLGLGDSSYQKFNVVGKRLQKRLEQLGAQSVLKLGLADDQHDLGVDAVVSPWLAELWTKVLDLHPLPQGLSIISSDVCPPSKYKVQFIDGTASNGHPGGDAGSERVRRGSTPCALCPFHARLISNRRVTAPDHFQDVRHLKLDVTGSGISYTPGDVVMVQPQNSPDTVHDFITLLGLDPARQFSIQQNDPDTMVPPSLPRVCSVEWVVSHYLDINSVPRRSFFELLAYHAKDELEREKLLDFCTPEGQEELYTYCNRVKRTILEVLQDFSKTSSEVPFQYLFDLIPPLLPRAFSIASSPKAHPDEIHVLMAVVEYKTKLHLPRRGVCSTWLAGLDPNLSPVVPVWVRRGTIRFPSDLSTPLVMVGPGTGLAPFRSALHERLSQGLGGSVLFFGCRNEKKDFYCNEEWTEMVDKGLLSLFTAFSRDQEEKIYVQHRIREQGELIWSMLSEKKAYFYIAGNAKSMPDDVKEALTDVIGSQGHMTPGEATTYVQHLERTRRFQVEAWS